MSRFPRTIAGWHLSMMDVIVPSRPNIVEYKTTHFTSDKSLLKQIQTK